MKFSIETLKAKLEVCQIVHQQINKSIELPGVSEEDKEKLKKENDQTELNIKELEKAIKVLEAASS